MAKVGKKKGSGHDPNYTSSSVKHGGGIVLGLLVYNGDTTRDCSKRVNE